MLQNIEKFEHASLGNPVAATESLREVLQRCS